MLGSLGGANPVTVDNLDPDRNAEEGGLAAEGGRPPTPPELWDEILELIREELRLALIWNTWETKIFLDIEMKMTY